MKLVIKIAAGILLAWGLILVSAFLIAVTASKAITSTTVQPQIEQLAQPFTLPTPTYTPTPLVWLDISFSECMERDGNWAYDPSTYGQKVRCGVQQ